MPTHRQRHARRAAEAEARGHDSAPAEEMRLDKWLWVARFYKTRVLSAAAIEAGKVRSEGERVKPAHVVKAGQRYTIVREGLSWTITVRGVAEQRGSAAAAAALYVEDEGSIAERARIFALNRAGNPSPFKGRPTKRQRRKIEDFLAEP